jgi:hypothetical protein
MTLGTIVHFFTEIVFKSYMLSGAGGVNSPKQCFEDVINSVQWPSHITCLPKNVSTMLFPFQTVAWSCHHLIAW